jgi:uncharacterized SAM-dependent methyltransferase
VFFPGSTIGNFEPAEAQGFLARLGALVGPGALLLLGADSNRDPATLIPAYNDEAGVTAEFNRNVLEHINRTHGARFDLSQFDHCALWNAERSRIEMHLISRGRQNVRVGGMTIRFEAGESIVTEHCYKHAPEQLRGLLVGAGWRVRELFPDAARAMHLWLAAR